MSGPPAVTTPGELQALIQAAQRGEVDLATVEIAPLAARVRERLGGGDPTAVDAGPAGDDRLAAWVQGLARLLRLKADRTLVGSAPDPPEPPEPPVDEEVRLAEARLFRAAADALISDPAAGPQAFLRVLGLAVEPQVELRVSAEALAAALRQVLERLPPALAVRTVPVAHSVAAKVAELRERLAAASPIAFADCFAAARDRMEAIAYFLALLELVASGGARCTQAEPAGPIEVARG